MPPPPAHTCGSCVQEVFLKPEDRIKHAFSLDLFSVVSLYNSPGQSLDCVDFSGMLFAGFWTVLGVCLGEFVGDFRNMLVLFGF